MKNLSRRKFLLGSASVIASLALNIQPGKANSIWQVPAPSNRVVHTHHRNAVTWNYSTGWYGDYVSQSIVNDMTDRGVMDLTNAITLADGWRTLIPNYLAGEKVAIKVNFNNATSCSMTDNVIDALPQPVNAVIRGLKAIGIPESAIYIYDVTRGWHDGAMPTRLINKITALYPNVQFHAYTGSCVTGVGFSTTQKIHFNVPADGVSTDDLAICTTLVNAKYLINMPIMKKHGMAGVTLGFKNHFGSFDQCQETHWSVDLGDAGYISHYNTMVDMMNNPHFKAKTVLTVGDALYGARINNYSEVPSRWPTFGNQSPNSLFFSRDPVAIDCVMYDFLDAEGGVPAGSDDYLKLASTAGLGTFEHRDDSNLYHSIDYRKFELDGLDKRTYLPCLRKP